MSAYIRSSNNDQQSKVGTGNTLQPWSGNLHIPSTWDIGYPRGQGSPLMSCGSDVHLKTFCEQFTHNVLTLCAARACGLTLLPLKSWETPLYAVSGTASSADVRFAYQPMAGWVGWIVYHKQLLLVPDCADDTALRRFAPFWTWYNPRDTGIVSCHTDSQYLGVPLLVNEKVIGVLGLLRRREDLAFMAVDWHTLMGVAERHAAVIELLRQEQAKYTGVLEVLSELHRLRMQGAPLTQMWDVVLTQALPILGFDAGHIRIKKGDTLVLCALKDYPNKRPPRVRLLGQGISGWVAKHQRILRIGRNRSWRRIGIPLLDDGRVVGTLVACKRREDDVTETQLRWLQVIASTLATEMQSRWVKSIIEMLSSELQTSTSPVSYVRKDTIAPGEEDVLFEHAYGHLVG